MPSFKLTQKYRNGSKIIKKYDQPKTPYQRILESQHISEKMKNKLKEQLEKLNPFNLQKRMLQKIKAVIQEVNKECG